MSGIEKIKEIYENHPKEMIREDSVAQTHFAISEVELAEVRDGAETLDTYGGIEGFVGLLKSNADTGLSAHEVESKERLEIFGKNEGANAADKAKVNPVAPHHTPPCYVNPFSLQATYFVAPWFKR